MALSCASLQRAPRNNHWSINTILDRRLYESSPLIYPIPTVGLARGELLSCTICRCKVLLLMFTLYSLLCQHGGRLVSCNGKLTQSGLAKSTLAALVGPWAVVLQGGAQALKVWRLQVRWFGFSILVKALQDLSKPLFSSQGSLRAPMCSDERQILRSILQDPFCFESDWPTANWERRRAARCTSLFHHGILFLNYSGERAWMTRCGTSYDLRRWRWTS